VNYVAASRDRIVAPEFLEHREFTFPGMPPAREARALMGTEAKAAAGCDRQRRANPSRRPYRACSGAREVSLHSVTIIHAAAPWLAALPL